MRHRYGGERRSSIPAREFHYFSTVTTLGTPRDTTLQEVRIECFFPVDELPRRNARALAGTRP